MIAIVIAGFLSALSAFVLLLVLLYRIARRRSKEIAPIKIFYLWLLFWDVIQGIGSILNIQWIHHGDIVIGNFCVSQALIKQLSNTGTALSIMAMSCCILHDYVIEPRGPHRPWRPMTGLIGICIISLIQVVDIGLPNALFHGSDNYYGISGYWCWISANHFTTKIVTEYLWFWLAWVFSFLTAIAFGFSVHYKKLLPAGFFWIGIPIGADRLLRIGLVSIDSPDRGRVRWGYSLSEITFPTRTIRVMLPLPVQYLSGMQLDVNRRRPNRNTSHAFKLLMFPLAYLVLIAPLSIVRFLGFRNHPVDFQTTISSGLVFAFSGFVDVILFNWAKPAFGMETKKITNRDNVSFTHFDVDDLTEVVRSIPTSKS